jgi:transcriptional regulator with GAF, ATPase, and Fis domain
VILADGAVLNGALPQIPNTSESSAPVTLDDASRSHILQTLHETAGVVGGPNGAASRLGMKRTTLIAKMKRLGVGPFQGSSGLARAASVG